MSHQFKLLLLTCLTCVCVAPDALANVSFQLKLPVGDDRTRDAASAVLVADAQTDPQAAATMSIAQNTPASPTPTAVRQSPTPARPTASARTASPTPAQPVASPTAPATPAAGSALKSWTWWGAIGIIPIGILAAILYTLRPKPDPSKADKQTPKPQTDDIRQTEKTEESTDENQPDEETSGPRSIALQEKEKLPLTATTRLARVDIIEALIHDLHKPDPSQRRKAIWELGQRGDSRAIQPLVDLLVDADSNQRGLILAAVTEISIRTLKPMNRALMLSMQDGSPDVRKNALRDVTRVFELVTQTNQLLQYAASDADVEVRETAQWAMNQLSRVRPGLAAEGVPGFSNPSSSPSRLPSLAELHTEGVSHSKEEIEPSSGG